MQCTIYVTKNYSKIFDKNVCLQFSSLHFSLNYSNQVLEFIIFTLQLTTSFVWKSLFEIELNLYKDKKIKISTNSEQFK